ncbi:MAG: hypothetical protein GX230_01125 [Lentisphaerae bacterium]|mgnify:CR=1 FL=1|jgi:aspartyl-tRNA(Asn)/glutamyl-tRNA(Gln) amidotransferase subunit A|nr:hypothetical protein [Lentisphaerota bacterium]
MTFVFENSSAVATNATPGTPLHGIRMALQPNIAVATWPAEAGTAALAGYIPTESATIADRAQAAGASIIGYTQMSELGFSLHRSAAAKAIVQNKADVELALDLFGEPRLAAAANHLCSLKPSFGTLSRFGLTGLMATLETPAITAATPELIATTLKAISGTDPLDPSMPADQLPTTPPAINELTLGVVRDSGSTLDSTTTASFNNILSKLQQAGITVREVTIPEWQLYRNVHQIIGSVEATSSAGRYDSVRFGKRPAGAKNWNEMYLTARGCSFGTLLKSLLFQGASFQFKQRAAYDNACRIRSRLVASMAQLISTVDALLLPLPPSGTTSTQPTLDEVYQGATLTLPANLTGQPALVIPTTAPLPLQLLGTRLSDYRLLAIGEKLLTVLR